MSIRGLIYKYLRVEMPLLYFWSWTIRLALGHRPTMIQFTFFSSFVIWTYRPLPESDLSSLIFLEGKTTWSWSQAAALLSSLKIRIEPVRVSLTSASVYNPIYNDEISSKFLTCTGSWLWNLRDNLAPSGIWNAISLTPSPFGGSSTTV